MPSLGIMEMVWLAILALLIFGPERLPKIARNVGHAIGVLRRETNRAMGELKDVTDTHDDLREVVVEAQALRASIQEVKTSATTLLLDRAVDPGLETDTPGAYQQSGVGTVQTLRTPFDPDAP